MKIQVLVTSLAICTTAFAQNSWTQKASFGGLPRLGATGFCIGTNGYIGTGYSNMLDSLFNDFWEYNPVTDAWIQKANFGGSPRIWATGFSIGTKGYIGAGHLDGVSYSDFWQYDPITNVWTPKANFAGGATSKATGFSIGNKGYMGTGVETSQDFWQYDPAINIWTPPPPAHRPLPPDQPRAAREWRHWLLHWE